MTVTSCVWAFCIITVISSRQIQSWWHMRWYLQKDVNVVMVSSKLGSWKLKGWSCDLKTQLSREYHLGVCRKSQSSSLQRNALIKTKSNANLGSSCKNVTLLELQGRISWPKVPKRCNIYPQAIYSMGRLQKSGGPWLRGRPPIVPPGEGSNVTN